MANPKIVYTPAGAGDQTLSFTFPPRQLPAYQKVAVRHDNVSTAGVRESVLERFDDYLEFTVEWIKPGADVNAWQNFLDHALIGAPFAYYPDAGQSAFINYVLEDMEAKLSYRAPGAYSLALKLRRLVA